MARALLLALACMTAALAGCGGGTKPVDATKPAKAIVAKLPDPFDVKNRQAPGTRVGKVGDGRAYVAVVIEGKQAAVYVCDGVSADWFGGKLDGNRLALRSEAGTVIDAKVKGDAVRGTLKGHRGGEQDFTARPPESPGTGLFAGVDPAVHGYVRRWIVLPEGVRGVSLKATAQAARAGTPTTGTTSTPTTTTTSTQTTSTEETGGTTTGTQGGETTSTQTSTQESPPVQGAKPKQISNGASTTVQLETQPPGGGAGDQSTPDVLPFLEDETQDVHLEQENQEQQQQQEEQGSNDGDGNNGAGGNQAGGRNPLVSFADGSVRFRFQTITDGTSNTLLLEENPGAPRRLTLPSIQDGTSNTFLFGEAPEGGVLPGNGLAGNGGTEPALTAPTTTAGSLCDNGGCLTLPAPGPEPKLAGAPFGQVKGARNLFAGGGFLGCRRAVKLEIALRAARTKRARRQARIVARQRVKNCKRAKKPARR